MRSETLLAVAPTLVEEPSPSQKGGSLVGSVLAGRYEVFDFVGAGGMGEVYRARDRELDEVVAVKVLRAELAGRPELVDRFRREVKLARRVTHRSVARTFELQESDGLRFLTMEYVDGEPLSRLVARRGPLGWEACGRIGVEIAAALDAAHAAGVVHRDVKPDNVLLTRDGRAVVTDFGVAFSAGEGQADASGTPAYMAPEQVKNEAVGPAADVFALGVSLFELVTGTLPFEGEGPVAVMFARLSKPAPDVRQRASGIPDGFAEVLARAMAIRPEDRFATAGELAAALEAVDGRRSTRAPPSFEVSPRTLGPETWTTIEVRGMERVRPATAHLAAALHDELTLRLSLVPHARLVARAPDGEGEAGDVVVAGSIVEDGARVSLRAHDAPRDELVWSGRFPFGAASIGPIADLASRGVALAYGLPEPPAVAADEGSPLDSEVLDLCLRARFHYRTPFAGDLERAVSLYAEALARAPGHPRVLAGQAMAIVRHAFFGHRVPASLDEARVAIERACAAAPHRPEPRLAEGHLALHSDDPVAAARSFREVLALAPGWAEGHEWLGRMLLEAGYVEAGTDRMRAAMRLDPGLVALRWEVARAQALEADWEEVDRLVAELVSAGRRGAVRWLGTVRLAGWRGDRAWLERLEVGLDAAPEADVFDPPFCRALLQALLHRDWARARTVMLPRALEDRFASRRRVVFYAQITCDAACFHGDLDAAFAALRRAVDHGCFDLHWLEKGPLLAPLRADPRHAPLHATVRERAQRVLDALYRS